MGAHCETAKHPSSEAAKKHSPVAGSQVHRSAGFQIGGMSVGHFLLRVIWIAIQLTLVIWLGQKGTLFFYQGF